MPKVKILKEIEILKNHRRLIVQVLANIDTLLLQYGITPEKKGIDNVAEVNWSKEVLTLLKLMPGLNTKAKITSALKHKLKKLSIQSQTISTRVATELLLNKNIEKQKVGKIYKYRLKKTREK